MRFGWLMKFLREYLRLVRMSRSDDPEHSVW